MNIDGFLIEIKNDIFIVTNKEGVKKEKVLELLDIYQNSTNKRYNYIMFNDILGYFHGYNLLKNTSIYCASVSKKYAIELFIKNREND